MRRRSFLFIAVLFGFSRLIFLNSQPVFFDSPEYIERLQNPQFIAALTRGHVPLHSGYILLFWPIYHAASVMSLPPLMTVLMVQIALALFIVWMLYWIIFWITENQQVAQTTALLWSINPLFWLSNETIMMETTYLFSFVAAWYSLLLFLRKNKVVYLCYSGIFLALATLTHVFVLLWIPLLLSTVLLKNKKQFLVVLLVYGVSFLASFLLSTFFIHISLQNSFWESSRTLLLSKLGEQSAFNISLKGLAIWSRNAFIPLLRNNTIGVCALACVGIWSLWRKNRTLFLLKIVWIIPAFFVNQWWDSLWYGRHALIAGIGICFTASVSLAEGNKLKCLTIGYVLFVSLYAMLLLRLPIPDVTESTQLQSLPENSLIIESHFARPQTQKVTGRTLIYVDEPGWQVDHLTQQIDVFLAKGNKVFVTSQALSEPYALYAGPYLHTLSLSYQKPFILQPLLSKYSFTEYKEVDPSSHLIIYKLSAASGPYPTVPKLVNYWRRFDFGDPIVQLWLHLQSHSNL